tara:strand:- start:454 stop:720 length:267 start_codon:yes stop_codon:yes gene_type:complete
MPYKTKIIKRRRMPTFEVVTNKKAPPRKTTPKSFWRDLVCGMSAGDWFILDSKDRMKTSVSAGKYARGRYSLYQHPELDNKYVFTITK